MPLDCYLYCGKLTCGYAAFHCINDQLNSVQHKWRVELISASMYEYAPTHRIHIIYAYFHSAAHVCMYTTQLLFRGNNRSHLNVRGIRPLSMKLKIETLRGSWRWMQKKTRVISPERQAVEIHFTLDRIVPIGRMYAWLISSSSI